MAKNVSDVRVSLKPSQVKPVDVRTARGLRASDLNTLGIGMDNAIFQDVKRLYSNVNYSMDNAPLQTTPSITNPIQFFQYWAPEAVEVVTAARKIDDIVGRTIAGSFEDEEIVTTVIERTGSAQPYTDTADIPLASWNQNFVTRSIVRFEQGLEMGYLEAQRATKMRIDDHRRKSESCAEALAIEHNNIGFYGYANGKNQTFGFLNDPLLPAYVSVAQGASGQTSWSKKTFNEITADIITAVGQLVNQLGGNFDPTKDAFTFTIPLISYQYLNTMNELGTKSVSQWLKETYPNIKLEIAVQLNGANGGSNVFYMHADKVKGGDTMRQYVPEVLRLIGVEKRAKVTIEDYASATAGVIVQYPIGVVRYSGI